MECTRGGTISEVVVHASELLPGPNPTFRLLATGADANDDALEATVSFELRRELPLQTTWPLPGDTVAVQTSVFATLDTDLDDVPNEALTLYDADGQRISGTVAYDAHERRLTVVPKQELRPGIAYTVVLKGGLEDRYGNSLSTDYSWSFYTLVSPSPSAQ